MRRDELGNDSAAIPTPDPAPPTRPRTAAQRDAARRNGARSQGPRTEAGKAAASRNALKHGLTARVHLVLTGEDAGALDEMAQAVATELTMAGPATLPIADEMAGVTWRRGRAIGLETAALRTLLALPFEGSPAVRAAERRLALLIRYQGELARELARLHHDLEHRIAAASATVAAPATPAAAAQPLTASALLPPGARGAGPARSR